MYCIICGNEFNEDYSDDIFCIDCLEKDTTEKVIDYIKQTNNQYTNKQIIDDLRLDCTSENITNIRSRNNLPGSPRGKQTNKQTKKQTHKQTNGNSNSNNDADFYYDAPIGIDTLDLIEDIIAYLERYYISKEMKLKIKILKDRLKI